VDRFKRGDLDGALADLTKVIELSPTSTIAYLNRAIIRRIKGDLEGAFADCSKVIELNPGEAGSYNTRGNVQSDRGNLQAALADYTKALELEPENALLYSNRGGVYAKLGQYEKSIIDYCKALLHAPEWSSPINNLAWLSATCPRQEFRDGKRAIKLATRVNIPDASVDRTRVAQAFMLILLPRSAARVC
jgi:tetratricopeptide (TPR) repeat protein